MNAIARRIAALESQAAPITPMLLFIGRSDLNDETEAIGFEHCLLVRESGETWQHCKDRFAQWTALQPSPFTVGHIQYRDDPASRL